MVIFSFFLVYTGRPESSILVYLTYSAKYIAEIALNIAYSANIVYDIKNRKKGG